MHRAVGFHLSQFHGQKILCTYANHETPCALKEMSLLSVKQSDVNDECIQEGPVVMLGEDNVSWLYASQVAL